MILALLTPAFTAIELACFMGAVYFDRNLPNISLPAVRNRKAKEMMLFGVKSAAMLVSSRLQNGSVPLIIGHVIGLGHVVYFVMPNRLVDYARGVSEAIGFPLTPYFGATIGRGEARELHKIWMDTSLILQTASLAMAVGVFFCGEAFLGLWLGREYALAGRMVLYIVGAGLIAHSLACSSYRILIAHGEHGKCALTWLALSTLSIPMGIAGAHLWGIEGVAAGTAITTVVGNIVTLSMACSLMKIGISGYLKGTVLRLLIPVSLLGSGLWGLNYMYPIDSYLSLACHLLIACSVYILAVFIFSLDGDSRGKVMDRVKLRAFSR